MNGSFFFLNSVRIGCLAFLSLCNSSWCDDRVIRQLWQDGTVVSDAMFVVSASNGRDTVLAGFTEMGASRHLLMKKYGSDDSQTKTEVIKTSGVSSYAISSLNINKQGATACLLQPFGGNVAKVVVEELSAGGYRVLPLPGCLSEGYRRGLGVVAVSDSGMIQVAFPLRKISDNNADTSFLSVLKPDSKFFVEVLTLNDSKAFSSRVLETPPGKIYALDGSLCIVNCRDTKLEFYDLGLQFRSQVETPIAVDEVLSICKRRQMIHVIGAARNPLRRTVLLEVRCDEHRGLTVARRCELDGIPMKSLVVPSGDKKYLVVRMYGSRIESSDFETSEDSVNDNGEVVLGNWTEYSPSNEYSFTGVIAFWNQGKLRVLREESPWPVLLPSGNGN